MAAPFSTPVKRSLRKICPVCDFGIYSHEHMVWDSEFQEFVHEWCPTESREVKR